MRFPSVIFPRAVFDEKNGNLLYSRDVQSQGDRDN